MSCCRSRYFSERVPVNETETLFVSLWGVFLFFCAFCDFCVVLCLRRLAALDAGSVVGAGFQGSCLICVQAGSGILGRVDLIQNVSAGELVELAMASIMERLNLVLRMFIKLAVFHLNLVRVLPQLACCAPLF